MTIQKRNAALIRQLGGPLQRRWEPNFHWGLAYGAHMMLPYLRAFYPYSGIGGGGQVYDYAGENLFMDNDTVSFAVHPTLANGGVFDYGSNSRLYRPTTAHIEITDGLTYGGWFRPTALPSAGQEYRLMGKTGGDGNRGFRLQIRDDYAIETTISDDGTGQYAVAAGWPLTIDRWVHIMVRFDPGNQLSIYTDGIAWNFSVDVPGNIFNSSAPLEIGAGDGALAGGYAYYTGHAALNFVCATAVPHHVLLALFWHSCAMFDIRPPVFG